MRMHVQRCRTTWTRLHLVSGELGNDTAYKVARKDAQGRHGEGRKLKGWKMSVTHKDPPGRDRRKLRRSLFVRVDSPPIAELPRPVTGGASAVSLLAVSVKDGPVVAVAPAALQSLASLGV